jgi:ethanolamine utilization protein EutA
LQTGCFFVGARHVQVVPGSYQIVRLSTYAQRLFEYLGIRKAAGTCLTPGEVDALLDIYLRLLVGTLSSQEDLFATPIAHLHRQAPFHLPPDLPQPIVTLSGGVGELVYAYLRGEPWPPTTHFGDLGIDLAQRLVSASPWVNDFKTHALASSTQATVYGLLRHVTQVSGNTLYLPRPELLPLRDLPILGTISHTADEEQLREVLGRIQRSVRGGCAEVSLIGCGVTEVRQLGRRIDQALKALHFPPEHPVVFLLAENLGKVLGQYATDWGALPLHLIVIDEIAVLDAQFLHLGRLQDQVLPVSFYGMNAVHANPGEPAP